MQHAGWAVTAELGISTEDEATSDKGATSTNLYDHAMFLGVVSLRADASRTLSETACSRRGRLGRGGRVRGSVPDLILRRRRDDPLRLPHV